MSQPDYLISTPENVDLHLEFAGLGNRILACLIDTLITYLLIALMIGICAVGTFFITATSMPSWPKATLSISLVIVTMIGIFIVYYGYFIYFESTWQGQTPGKRFVGIRVIEENGQPVGASSVWIRNLLRIVDEGLLLIGLLVMFIDRNEHRLGDLAANTIVIRERNSGVNARNLALTTTLSPNDHFDVGGLTAAEYELLISFINRRKDLDNIHRVEVAKKIAQYFASKLTIVPEPTNSESFLEKLLLSYELRAET